MACALPRNSVQTPCWQLHTVCPAVYSVFMIHDGKWSAPTQLRILVVLGSYMLKMYCWTLLEQVLNNTGVFLVCVWQALDPKTAVKKNNSKFSIIFYSTFTSNKVVKLNYILLLISQESHHHIQNSALRDIYSTQIFTHKCMVHLRDFQSL